MQILWFENRCLASEEFYRQVINVNKLLKLLIHQKQAFIAKLYLNFKLEN